MSLAFPLCFEPHSHPLPELRRADLLAYLTIAVDDVASVDCGQDVEPSRLTIVAFEANSDGILGSAHFLHFASCKSVRDGYLRRVQETGRHIINCYVDETARITDRTINSGTWNDNSHVPIVM